MENTYNTPYPKGYNGGSHETTWVDLITPGTSTVATFKTTILNLLDSIRLKHSVDKRLHYVVPRYPPLPPYLQGYPAKRLGVR